MITDFRDAVFNAVGEIMSKDKDVLALYNDMGAMGLDKIRNEFPGRVINAGIAEQNMASVAAGLAMTGKRVFMYGIMAHIFSRGFEQIRNDICCPNLPVTILGVGSGLSYGTDGPTHHGVQDIAVMRTLPNMAIYNPADSVSAHTLVKLADERRGPGYIRMDKEQLPALYGPEADFRAGFSVLHKGSDIALLATGVLVHRAMEAARQLADEGINVRVMDIFRLKPIDSNALYTAIEDVNAVLTVEENSPIGGLSSIIAELVALHDRPITFASIALGDEPMMSAASRKWAEEKNGLTRNGILTKLRQMAKATHKM
jgi:transketolase